MPTQPSSTLKHVMRTTKPLNYLYQQKMVRPLNYLYQLWMLKPQNYLYQLRMMKPLNYLYQRWMLKPLSYLYHQRILKTLSYLYQQRMQKPLNYVYQQWMMKPLCYLHQQKMQKDLSYLYQQRWTAFPLLDVPKVTKAMEDGHYHVLADMVRCAPHLVGTIELVLDKASTEFEFNDAALLSGLKKARERSASIDKDIMDVTLRASSLASSPGRRREATSILRDCEHLRKTLLDDKVVTDEAISGIKAGLLQAMQFKRFFQQVRQHISQGEPEAVKVLQDQFNAK